MADPWTKNRIISCQSYTLVLSLTATFLNYEEVYF